MGPAGTFYSAGWSHLQRGVNSRGSLRPPGVVTPAIAAEFNRSFKLVRALPCDVQLGDHGAQYNMQQKFARVRPGGRNPFIEPATCTLEADIEEAMFRAILAEQQKTERP